MKPSVEIVEDASGHKIVILPDIIFKNRQNIDWNAVEEYLQKYVGEIITIAETEEGANAKAKANAAQGIMEMLKIATEKRFRKNRKDKHSINAGNGWYYYTTRFAMPIYENETKTENYHCYSANHAENGKLYLYDLVDIKREASTPLTIRKLTPW